MTLQLSSIQPAVATVEYRSAPARPAATTASPSGTDQVTLSEAARAMLADGEPPTDAHDITQRLEAIKARPAVQRTPAEAAFVNRHDERLRDIQDKTRNGGPEALTADELGYLQQAMGFVNTMSALSPKEKALHDELVASGNALAAQGLHHIALARTGQDGQALTLPNGVRFDPRNTELTGDSVTQLYPRLFDDPSGEADRAFAALASALQQRQAG